METPSRAICVCIGVFLLQTVHGARHRKLFQSLNLTSHPTFNQDGLMLQSVRMRSRHFGNYPGGEYDVFKNAPGVSNGALEDLHFAKVSEPAKQAVRFITIVGAGLQTGWGTQQSITGQQHKFKQGYSGGGTDRWMNLDSRSFVNLVAQSNKVFPSTNTLFLDVFSSSFKPSGWDGRFEGDRVALMAAWKAYLDTKVNWANIKGMMFAGMSRGGCFVFRFSDYLLNNAASLDPNVKVIMELTDSVCDQGEGYTERSNGIVNPKRPSGSLWKGWKTDFSKASGWGHEVGKHRAELCILTQGGGDDAGAGFGRYFVPDDASDTEEDDQTWSVTAPDSMGGGDWTWLRFFWTAATHKEHGRNFMVNGKGQTPFGVPRRDSAGMGNAAGNYYTQHEATTKHAYMCAERYSRVYADWTACEPDSTKPCGKGVQKRTCSRDSDWDPWFLHGSCDDIAQECDLDHDLHPCRSSGRLFAGH